jgi:hypothetical protein
VEIRFSYGFLALSWGPKRARPLGSRPGVRPTNSAAKVSAKRARKRSQRVSGAKCLRASSRRNGQRDETKFFDARNSAETELPYDSLVWAPSWGQGSTSSTLAPACSCRGFSWKTVTKIDDFLIFCCLSGFLAGVVVAVLNGCLVRSGLIAPRQLLANAAIANSRVGSSSEHP